MPGGFLLGFALQQSSIQKTSFTYMEENNVFVSSVKCKKMHSALTETGGIHCQQPQVHSFQISSQEWVQCNNTSVRSCETNPCNSFFSNAKRVEHHASVYFGIHCMCILYMRWLSVLHIGMKGEEGVIYSRCIAGFSSKIGFGCRIGNVKLDSWHFDRVLPFCKTGLLRGSVIVVNMCRLYVWLNLDFYGANGSKFIRSFQLSIITNMLCFKKQPHVAKIIHPV